MGYDHTQKIIAIINQPTASIVWGENGGVTYYVFPTVWWLLAVDRAAFFAGVWLGKYANAH